MIDSRDLKPKIEMVTEIVKEILTIKNPEKTENEISSYLKHIKVKNVDVCRIREGDSENEVVIVYKKYSVKKA